MSTINQGHMMYGYGSWDMKCKGQNLLSFWAILFPFDAPSNPKSQKFEKIKKMLDDIIILPLRTTNDNHDVWFLIYQARQTYDIWFLGSSLAIFCPFTPLKWKYHKIEKKKKKKIPGDIILHKCSKNHDHRLYCSWDMAHDGCNYYFSGLFFTLLLL